MKQLLVEEMVDFLAGMDEIILRSLIGGSFSRKAEIVIPRNLVRHELQEMKDQNPPAPAIYVNIICDRAGISPTPSQWEEICALMSRYVSTGRRSDDLAFEVDRLICPLQNDHPPQLRRYTDFGKVSEIEDITQPDSSRREVVRAFVRAMQHRIGIESASTTYLTPFSAPVIDIGFSVDADRTLSEYRRHQSSDYLLCLAEACFKYEYPNRFRLQQSIIYDCFRHSQPLLGETVLNQVAQGYALDAQGFCHTMVDEPDIESHDKTDDIDWGYYETRRAEAGELDREREKMLQEAIGDQGTRNLAASLIIPAGGTGRAEGDAILENDDDDHE